VAVWKKRKRPQQEVELTAGLKIDWLQNKALNFGTQDIFATLNI